MSALSDEEDIELFKGFGAEEPNHRNQLRTKKRWSFNNPAARQISLGWQMMAQCNRLKELLVEE